MLNLLDTTEVADAVPSEASGFLDLLLAGVADAVGPVEALLDLFVLGVPLAPPLERDGCVVDMVRASG